MIEGVSIPLTAWEQAGIVVLFIIGFLVILTWVSRENKASREFQRSEAKSREVAQASRDAEWRLFLAQQREADIKSSEAVQRSLDALAAATQSLVTEVQGQRADFSTHDAYERAKLGEMSASIHPPTPIAERKRRGGTA
jgi:hypothetical protein